MILEFHHLAIQDNRKKRGTEVMTQVPLRSPLVLDYWINSLTAPCVILHTCVISNYGDWSLVMVINVCTVFILSQHTACYCYM